MPRVPAQLDVCSQSSGGGINGHHVTLSFLSTMGWRSWLNWLTLVVMGGGRGGIRRLRQGCQALAGCNITDRQ